MDYKRFGKTTFRTSKMGIGLAALGRPGYINLGHGEDLEYNYQIDEMERRAHDVLDHAYSSGIRYFDAARSYGRGEEFLGHWLDKNPEKKDTVIGSKWGYTYTAGWKVNAEKHEIKEHSLPVLARQVLETRSNLDGHLSIYHIHSATLESGVLENTQVLNQLERLKEEGLVIGLSVSGGAQAEVIKKSLEIEYDKTPLFGSLQVSWNILEKSTTSAIKAAKEAGYGIIVKEAVANGRLTERNSFADNPELLKALKQIADKHCVSIDAIAMAYILHQDWMDVVLSGAATIEQLESNLKAVALKLSQDELGVLDAIEQEPQHYWKTRKALRWN